MTPPVDVRLCRLLQLASPALPVGAYSYSQGLESAIEARVVRDAASARCWIEQVLEYSMARTEAPLLLRMTGAWERRDIDDARRWNELFLATRETAELHAETLQMGYSLTRLLGELELMSAADRGPASLTAVSFPCAFAYAVACWRIDVMQALTAYTWSWLENQVMAAIKAVPLGQTDGQRMLLAMGERLPEVAARAAALADEDIGSFAPGLGILSSLHETQYSRLFRS